MDAAGDLFIADYGNNRIREVNLATGVITTVAGNGTDGYSGDNGPGHRRRTCTTRTASRWTPPGTSSSPISDNNRIREVNLATGVITTVAGNGTDGYSGDGGPATAAELRRPRGVAVDAAGDLFIADYCQQPGPRGESRHRRDHHRRRQRGCGLQRRQRSRPPPPNWTSPTASRWTPPGTSSSPTPATTAIREVNLATGVITTVAGNGH